MSLTRRRKAVDRAILPQYLLIRGLACRLQRRAAHSQWPNCKSTGTMATSTVVVAREDLSIPGALEPNNAGINSPEQVENQFFNLLDQHKADAVVLDLMGSQGHGVAAIRRTGGA